MGQSCTFQRSQPTVRPSIPGFASIALRLLKQEAADHLSQTMTPLCYSKPKERALPPPRGEILTVQTGVITAPVYLFLTVGAVVAQGAVAGVAPQVLLHTGAPIEAGPVSTGHGADFAVLAVEALRAGALVVVLQVLQERNRGREGGLSCRGKQPQPHGREREPHRSTTGLCPTWSNPLISRPPQKKLPLQINQHLGCSLLPSSDLQSDLHFNHIL